MKHIPVLLKDVVDKVKEIESKDGFFLDGTFGRGGHTHAILKVRPDFKVIGLDCDKEAIDFGVKHYREHIENGQLTLYQGHFDEFDKELSVNHAMPLFVGILLDLGVSSPQLDEGPRGFSFYHDGPLDMRMNQAQEFSAKDIVNTWSEEDLVQLFRELGEVRSPFRVVKKIIEARREKELSRTSELSFLIEKTEGWRKKGQHPATHYFMALRIEVNQELARIEKALPKLVQSLLPKGRLLVITFHSLEDRIVKVAMKNFAEQGLGRLVNKKVIQSVWAEKKENPRARSAKLRVFEKQ